jgi:ATP-dependent Lon protease
MVAATRVLHGLDRTEVEYYQKLPSSAKRRIRRTLRSCAAQQANEPLRVRILRDRHIPNDVKMTVFQQLSGFHDEKVQDLARNLLRLPLGLFSTRPPACTQPGDHQLFLENAMTTMNESIYGHDEVKREVLLMLSQWTAGGHKSFALGLEGGPGIGKTTFVKHALSKVLNRPMCVICLGGASDVSQLMGHGFTYEGARHGRLAQSLIEAGVSDPILFFDELDKVSNTARGDEIINALIHLTDPVQNTAIRDRYFQGVDLDFSRCIMVFSYNEPRNINPVLLDRLKRIRMRGPTRDEKRCITAEHIVPRVRADMAAGVIVELSPHAVEEVVKRHENDTGMRGIEKSVHHIIGVANLCWQYGSGTVIGYDDALEVSDGTWTLSRHFVTHVLERQGQVDAVSAPPPMMFT